MRTLSSCTCIKNLLRTFKRPVCDATREGEGIANKQSFYYVNHAGPAFLLCSVFGYVPKNVVYFFKMIGFRAEFFAWRKTKTPSWMQHVHHIQFLLPHVRHPFNVNQSCLLPEVSCNHKVLFHGYACKTNTKYNTVLPILLHVYGHFYSFSKFR